MTMHIRPSTRSTYPLSAGLACLLLLTGCQHPVPAPVAPDRSLMWPPPPAEPRVAYLRNVSGPADLGIRRSWWRRAGAYLVGDSRFSRGFAKPAALCFDEAGNLCVTDTGIHAVWYFDVVHSRFKCWTRLGKLVFSSPVAIVKRDGVFYVADSGLGAVVAFNEAGHLLFQITEELERPVGLALAGDTLWVVDSAQHRISGFNLQGRPKSCFGKRGVAEGEFNYPTHLSASPDSALFVTDAMNFRIQKVDLHGRPLLTIGAVGNVSGTFSRPKGTAVDAEGNVYIVDALFDNVQVFDREGGFLMHFGSHGTKPGRFWLPSGIALDAMERIWVADSYNRRIQVFKRVGEP